MRNYKKIIKKLIDAEKTANPKATVAGKIGVSENYIYMILAGTHEPGPKIKLILDRMGANNE